MTRVAVVSNMEQGLKQYFGKCPVLCRGAVAHWVSTHIQARARIHKLNIHIHTERKRYTYMHTSILTLTPTLTP